MTIRKKNTYILSSDSGFVQFAPEIEGSYIAIYNASGKPINSFHARIRPCWDCDDKTGRRVPPGVYYINMRKGTDLFTEKVMLGF